MRTRSIVIIGVLLVAASIIAAMILRSDRVQPRSAEGEEHAPGPLDYPRGPRGARLLSDGSLQVEMTIYETGVPPQFRVYPYDANLKPIPPKDVSLQVELHRLGGRVDRINFVPEADYLRGTAEVEEPHSFDVKVIAQHAGATHAWSYSQTEGKVKLGPDQIASAGITINTVGAREMVTLLELPGEVKADETRVAHVVPRLQGVIEEVRKQQGDRVRKGEVIAVLSSRELADAKRDYIEDAYDAEYRRVIVEREEMLWKKKISAEQDYRLAEKLAEQARLALKLSGQKLIVLGVPASALEGLAAAPADTMARYELRAPLDGVVVERNVTVGEAVTAEQDIFTLADLSIVWVDVSVYAKDLGAVRVGQQATVVSTDLGIEANGRLSYLGPLVGQESRTAVARIVLSNRDAKWRPGLFVTVRLVRDSATVPVTVAAEAIQTFRDWQVVFVKDGDWFEGRPVELGRSDGQWVEVLKGVKPGDEYAATNSYAIKAEIGKLGATHDH